MAHLAVLSYHTSPLAQPGTGDGGGMNVYVREISSHLARLGHDVDVYTRRDNTYVSDVVDVEPGFRVHHIAAGPFHELAREETPFYVDEFAAGVAEHFRVHGVPSAIHAHYWLSALAGHSLKHEFDIPLITTFHTLERVKAGTFEAESTERALQEERIIGCCDAVLASCDVESEQIISLYGADQQRVHVVPLGVEHAFFAPGHRPQARRALGLATGGPLVLFVGRLQALKGVDLALEAFISLRHSQPEARMAIVGGPSGPQGRETLDALHQRVVEAGVIGSVTFVAPQSHQMLSTWFRAADVTLVPSRSESFGLVALESSACGTPLVASRVGGLTTLVVSEHNGLLLESRDPEEWAKAIEWLLDESRSTTLSTNAVLLAANYTWRAAAQRVAALMSELASCALVPCP
ncbi:MAG: glycosyltransferase [Actinomycetota bacterium]